MLGKDYQGQVCSVAGALAIVGERWTLLVLRDIFIGLRRFDELQATQGVARNVLAKRLKDLVAAGILAKKQYQERPARYEYRLTESGLELWPVIVELMLWGDRHAVPAGPPLVLQHKECGGALGPRRICSKCGMVLEVRDVEPCAGPGARNPHPLRLRQMKARIPEATATA